MTGGEERTIAIEVKGAKGNQHWQKQAISERIAAQMVAQEHQWDWFQVRTKIKALNPLYVRGRDANRVSRASRDANRVSRALIPFHNELVEILQRDYIGSSSQGPVHSLRASLLRPARGGQSEAASATQESFKDLVSSVGLFLSLIAEAGTQGTPEVCPGQMTQVLSMLQETSLVSQGLGGRQVGWYLTGVVFGSFRRWLGAWDFGDRFLAWDVSGP